MLTDASPAPPRGRATLTVVCATALIVPVTATGAAEAVAGIGAGLHSGLAATQWVVNAFFLTFAALMAVTGSLADRFGPRRMFALGLVVFTAAMLVAAAAPTIGVLITARACAGVGAAATTTGGTALLAHVFPGATARGRAFAVFGTTLGLGLAFGPVLAGVLVTVLGWRSLFAVAALALLPSLAAVRALPAVRAAASGRLDVGGAVTFTGGLTGFTLGVVEGPDLGWAHPVVLGGFAACAVLLTVFTALERRHPAPLVDLSLLRDARFVAITSMPFLLAFGFVALTIVLPPYLMATLGYTARQAGLALLLLTGPTLVMPPLTGAIARRVSQRTLLVTTLLLVAAGTALLARVPGGAGPVALAGPLLLIGTGFGVSLAIMDGAAISAAPAGQEGMAAGVFNTARLTGEVVAIAVLGALISALTRTSLAAHYGAGRAAAATAGLLQGDPHAAPDAAVATAAYAHALHTALAILSALSVLGAAAVAYLLRTRRAAAEAPAPAASAPARH